MRRWLTIAPFLLLVAAGPGCRVAPAELTPGAASRRDVYPELAVGVDRPDDVRAKWGPPSRVFTFKDRVTGIEEVVWQYDLGRDGEGNVAAKQVVLRDGVVRRVETLSGDPAPKTFDRGDSASRRDLE